MQSKAATVTQYIASLPADRRAAIEAVRKVILANLDKNYEECMSYGMIGYVVPHRVYPAGYHCDPKLPLPFAGLASQKNYMSVYLMCIYGHGGLQTRFREAWSKTGKKLDMGKACIRFKKVEDLALDVIGATIKQVPAKKYIEYCEAALQATGKKASGGKTKTTVLKAKPVKSVSSSKQAKSPRKSADHLQPTKKPTSRKSARS